MPGWWYSEGRASARSGRGPGRTGVKARRSTEVAERGGAIEKALRGGRLLKTIPHLCPLPMGEEICLLAFE